MRGMWCCIMAALIELETPGLPYDRAEAEWTCAASIPTGSDDAPADSALA
jgi:hypothetical protein